MKILNKKKFFDLYRAKLDKNRKLSQKEVDAIDLFLDLFLANIDYFTIEQWAYVFATTFHETAFTFEPVKEAFHLSETWRKNNLRYYPWYGRGYVQTTWEINYKKDEDRTGIPFTKNPDLALVPDHAFCTMIYNMKHGRYTGKELGYYINERRKAYVYARYVVNGRDKRYTIASYAETFETILKQSIQ